MTILSHIREATSLGLVTTSSLRPSSTPTLAPFACTSMCLAIPISSVSSMAPPSRTRAPVSLTVPALLRQRRLLRLRRLLHRHRLLHRLLLLHLHLHRRPRLHAVLVLLLVISMQWWV